MQCISLAARFRFLIQLQFNDGKSTAQPDNLAMQPRPANPSGRPILRRKNMKKPIISLIAAVSFAVALLATTLAAPFTVKIRAEIPFDFMVGKKRLPKGEYLIESLNDSTLTIRNAKKGKGVSFMTIKS